MHPYKNTTPQRMRLLHVRAAFPSIQAHSPCQHERHVRCGLALGLHDGSTLVAPLLQPLRHEHELARRQVLQNRQPTKQGCTPAQHELFALQPPPRALEVGCHTFGGWWDKQW